jgi:uncharacterized membrane protein YbhN (UPF0104 family)
MTERHEPSSKSGESAWRRAWPTTKKILTLAFFVLVGVLLYQLGKRLEWSEVVSALRSYSATTLLLACAAAVGSYLVYSSFDLLGKRYTGHQLPVKQIMPVTFVCYAFNLNLSSWIGGVAFRYRLYTRLGLKKSTITRVLSLSLLTNWMGYLCLAGAVFASGLLKLPPGWKIGSGTLQIIGVVLLLVALTYFLLCAFSKRRSWTVRGHELSLPSLQMALAQVVLGAGNWALMAAVVFVLMPDNISYPTVLGVLLISSIAGVITHIPAGLGVLEALFIALLSHEASKTSLLAGLIGYRAIYFLAPLLLATVVYLVLEARAKKLRGKNLEAA